jgi:hypothetical protein
MVEVRVGVKTGKAQIEQMFSDLPSTADIGVHGWRFSCVPIPDSCTAADFAIVVLAKASQCGCGSANKLVQKTKHMR